MFRCIAIQWSSYCLSSGFVINLKKSVMTPSQEMEFLGMVINSKEITISLPEDKLLKVKLKYLDLYKSP